MAFSIICVEWTWESLLLQDPEARALVSSLWKYTTDGYWSDISHEIWECVGVFHILGIWDEAAPEEIVNLPEGVEETVSDGEEEIDPDGWNYLAMVKTELLYKCFDQVLALVEHDFRIENKRWLGYPFGFLVAVFLADSVAQSDFSAHAVEPYGGETFARAILLAALTVNQSVPALDLEVFSSRPFFVPRNGPPHILNFPFPQALLNHLRPPSLVAIQEEGQRLADRPGICEVTKESGPHPDRMARSLVGKFATIWGKVREYLTR